ncbi:FAD/FMN-containing dehydrogenase [Bradyrhizobium japonicum]|uniref:FAD/FMN-containing dehydrogenase n=1 Tax=Bradyrhizobium elkanii TaxID=29448 RepID=A0ABV4ERX1_BRAEL|nr:FAD-binding oxidoreductase [Bradyrhizobium elkanii]MBP2429664.1 FAD/FMN-containing dehydrogenase [Bradyrhizobium elkanii]MCP1736865.1 FAD/FMN-containing dehydrogenase [Bradyrhizobium elkanii]MCP1754909.1 FAD/FMN-containing dehydrogenase [Bradyrhizobium elkanii]MCP1980427.1 FAD/FMN-containing dehydrogenase [Bradyrhizobium elkanii]MCS3572205.1 FAD/FMN-containing dehydrogenase [Bradyrhizobium elkanii]
MEQRQPDDEVMGKSHSELRPASQLRLKGQVVLAGSAGYDEARRVWNGAVDRRPAMIAYCADTRDVVEAVTFARSRTFPVAVRSGGHNVAGLSVCDGGIVIDLSRMKRIDVDPVRRTARAEAGLDLGEFDRATQAHGLATTMGVNSDTGIAGLTLGGGFGKLGRKFGLTCDNLIAAEVVTAEGQVLRASATEHPDLLWGLKGGGGNFGIVTAFEYRLHPIGTSLPVASTLYLYDRAREAMQFYDEFARNAADEVNVDAALVTLPSGDRFFNISGCYVGSHRDGERALSPIVKFGSPLETRLATVPYLEIQSGGDALFPRGRRYYWKAQFLREIGAGAIDALLDAYARAPNTSSLLVLQHVGGAIARVPVSNSPYANRDAAFDCFPVAIWDDPAGDEANMRWARELWSAVRPYSTGGVYANNLGDEGEDRVRDAYGENYARLVALKNKYDPTNFFRLNQNIKPTT